MALISPNAVSSSDRSVGSRKAAAKGAARARAEADLAPLDELRAHAVYALVAPIVLIAVLLPFMPADRRVGLDALFGLATILLVVVLLGRTFARHRISTRIGARIATAFALVVGLTAAMPIALFYPAAGPTERLLLVATFCGILGNVCFVGSAWPVAPAYVGPLIVGALYGLCSAGDRVSLILAGLVFAGGLVIVRALDGTRKLALNRILARREVDDQAFTIERLLLDFEETEHEWLWEVDARLRLQNVAPRMAAAAHAEPSRLEALPFRSLVSGKTAPDDTDGTKAVLEAMAQRQAFRNRVVRLDGPEGPIWWRLSARPIEDAAGDFAGYRGIGADITAARTVEARIAHLATHDACTGLPNRTAFQARASSECVLVAETGQGAALLCLDIDGFKAVNDRLGHAAGDEVLKETARRLRTLLKPADFVARIGGDEFAIWTPSAVPAKVEALAERAVALVSVPIVLEDGAEVEVGASVGIATAPKHGIDADLLLVRADVALSRAQSDGRGQIRQFRDEYETALTAKRSLEADLRLAFARGEFELWYQPIVDAASGAVVCFEALLRWRSPARGFVSPADFIPAAEAAGLIVPLDCWVLQRACEDAASWPRDVHVAVNVSPHHFKTTRLVEDVQLALMRTGLDPHRLDIEVTEGVFLDRSTTAVDTLEALRGLGLRIALDDFGTGYSSLSYLIDFPIDKIKIDRAFVRDLVERHQSRAIVDAILGLARKLSIRVVAEGIETEEQALALKLRRCDELQGFLLGRPRPAGEVEAMLEVASSNYREAVPTHVDSALGMALAKKKQAI